MNEYTTLLGINNLNIINLIFILQNNWSWRSLALPDLALLPPHDKPDQLQLTVEVRGGEVVRWGGDALQAQPVVGVCRQGAGWV